MTTVWAIADLHLSFGVPDKDMAVFGAQWSHHAEKIAKHWKQLVGQDDLVLIPGDTSWAMTPEQARADLEWIHQLPGKKLLLRGNHDYWWTSLSKVQKVLPPSLSLLQNDAFIYEDVAIAGSRLWDSDEYSFNEFITFQDNPRARQLTEEASPKEKEKIFQRELLRLEVSLKALNARATKGQRRIAMTHYPPVGANLAPSRTSHLLEKYHIEVCVFGHLHNLRVGALPFGTAGGIRYILTACDATDFTPVKIIPLSG